MSNSAGSLYQAVIDNVIREAQADFEDMGESVATLQLLKTEWQKRLSAMNVTNYVPWDSNDRWSLGGPTMYYSNYDLGMPVLGGSAGGPGVPPVSAGPHVPGVAPGSGMPVGQVPGVPSQAPPSSNKPAVKQEESSGYSQYSGGQDGSGLVLPQVPQADGAPVVVTKKDLLAMIGDKMAEGELRQVDGSAEEVGSDLDDSEDDLNSEEEEGDNGMIMLCLYEKVQRVKNKWKFIFKDGVATINGSDYVFSRGIGEAEW